MIQLDKEIASVIIPTYSRPENLCRAIDSVLSQSYKEVEIIVVDDNGIGTEFQIETEKLLERYKNINNFRYIKHETNKNGSAARNTGARNATGKYLAFLDDDDVFCETKLEEQIKYLQEHKDNPDLGGVYCNTKNIGFNRTFITNNKLNGKLTAEILLDSVIFNSSTLLIYRNVFNSINGFDETFERHQDWEFMIRYFRMYDLDIVSPKKFLIIKYQTPNKLSKAPLKAISYLEKYLSTFKSDIEKTGRGKDIYHNRYITLTYFLLKHRYYKKAYNSFKKSGSFKQLSLHEFARCIFSLILNK